ncbi:DUF4468 domain-containing protein [Rufibacter soli]
MKKTIKKLILFIAVALTPLLTTAQEKYPELPQKDGVITYEGVVDMGESKSKDILYKAARQWFVETYKDANAVLQMDDKADGKLIGKGLHPYSFVNGVNISEVKLSFIVNIDVKDGKYRYKLYSFSGENKNSSLLSSTAAPSVYKINYDEEYKLLKEGKRPGYRGKIVSGLHNEAEAIIASLNSAMKKAEASTDW